ncbi:MAG: VTT domain-containing protein [SAR202 cluster bacterium]|nr:VTT domain-containing protein [SAR202 cluster bacterium]
MRPWLILVAVLFVALVAVFRDWLPQPGKAGYPGIFLLNLIGSGGFVLPAPAFVAVCLGGSVFGLMPLLVGLVAASAETLGELTGYIAGVSSQGLLERMPMRKRIEPWVARHGWAALFVFSVIPNPLFDVVGIAAGSLRFPLLKFLGVVFAGKVIKDTSFAYLCYAGLEDLVGWFGE